MGKRMILLVGCLILGVLLSGCGVDSGEQPAASPTTAGLAAMVGDPVAGKTAFETTCFACHGVDATGMPNNGKDLTTSGFVRALSDAQLVEFIINGRSINDPANTTSVDMPPRGGNPTLTDQDLLNIVAYLRTLEK